MVHATRLISAAAFLMLCLAGAEARAEMIFWSYSGGGNGDIPSGQSGFIPSPSGQQNPFSPGIDLITPPGGNSVYQGSATVPAVNLFTDNNTRGPNPIVIPFVNAPYHTDVTIIDKASGASGFVEFHGLLNGNANELTHISTIATSFVGPTMQFLTLGANRYTITIGPLEPLTWREFGSPGSGQFGFGGSLDAHVDVSPANAAATPEPSCLVLAGMGLVTVGGAAWRKRCRLKVS